MINLSGLRARFVTLYANKGPAKNDPVKSPGMPGAFLMEPLVAYCGDAFVFCRYLQEESEQEAFNCVFGALPANLANEPFSTDLPQWTWIQPMPQSDDPLGQAGYIGARW